MDAPRGLLACSVASAVGTCRADGGGEVDGLVLEAVLIAVGMGRDEGTGSGWGYKCIEVGLRGGHSSFFPVCCW